MNRINHLSMSAAAGVLSVLAGASLATPVITPITPPPGFTRVTDARLSASGTFVVGTCDTGPSTPTRAFRWAPSVSSVLLPIPSANGQPVVSVAGVDISADGSVVLATVGTASGSESVIWTDAGTSTALQAPMFSINPEGAALSADGQTVVGRYAFSGQPNRPRAAKWTAAGVVTALDAPNGLPTAFASAVSNSGSVIAGGAAPLNSAPAGALWVGSRIDRLTKLGPSIFFTDSSVTGVSGDGALLVGNLSGSDIFGTPTSGMFRWSTAAGANPQLITTLPGSQSISGLAINEDGAVLGGKLVFRETIPGPMPGQFVQVDVDRAMIWNPTDGVRLLSGVLTAQAVNVGTTDFKSVIDLSGDGRTLLTTATLTPTGPTQFVLINDLATRPQCTPSDVAGPNQSIGADGQLTADDIIVFLGWYFADDARADIAGANQSTTPDGQRTADDIIVFLGRYFAGC
ncbi:MAG: hypothetical protein MUE97_00450 [Phycisphaerales bacterium]|jgi:uncharacterized membrane protein|nr:hypothetical protein [Phycisphaerales bacterium]